VGRRSERIRAIAEGRIAAFRAKRTAQKRLERARRREQGLTSNGTTVKRPDLVAAGLARNGHHPGDCLCYDCLYPQTPQAPELAYRMRGRLAR
jgi:hypothetical protein